MRRPMTDTPAYGYAWAFVALEYWALVLNRIYLVYVGDRMLSGACMGGPVMALPYPREAWDPMWWLSERRLRRYAGVNVEGPGFRGRHWANFQLPRSDIGDVSFDESPKWGMGRVPYSGRIHVAWRDGSRRELILMGRQDGPAIRDRLLPPHARIGVGSEDAVPRSTWTLPRPGIIVPGT